MKKRYYIPILVVLCFSFLSCTIAPEEPGRKDPIEEIGEEQPADEIDGKQPVDDIDVEQPADEIDEDQPEEPQQDVSLHLVAISEDTVGIDLTNMVPVRGVQFTIEGLEIANVLTTSRSEDFIVSFNGENGKVLIVSLTGDEIAPGEGLIAEILFDGTSGARLSEIVIVE